MKHLNKYLDFIKENLEESLEKSTDSWKLDNIIIEDIFIDFIDSEWKVHVSRGFLKDGEFTEIILLGDDVKPAYYIDLNTISKTSSEDLTNDFKNCLSTLSNILDNKDIKLFDGTFDDYNLSVLKLEDITMKGGVIIGDIIEDKIGILISENELIKVGDDLLKNYYNWDSLIVDVDIITLANRFGGYWTDTLIKCDEYQAPIDEFWDNYDHHYYHVDVISLTYDLNDENL